MARETRLSKTETLTIRLDTRTRFALDVLSRLRGQTITTIIERSIMREAESEHFKTDVSQYLIADEIWDEREGIRQLRLATVKELFPTFEELRRLNFAREHWPFFYRDKKFDEFRERFIDILWPRIDEFVAMHEENKRAGVDWYATGKAMRQALQDAMLPAPDWPFPYEQWEDDLRNWRDAKTLSEGEE